MSETYTPPLSTVSGKDYLEVKHRVYWVRQEHKDAQIVTDLIQLDAEHGYAVVKAVITLPATGAIGTGYGMAERGGSGPAAKRYVEFAETRAIGRACAAIGYGTLAALEEDTDPADAPQEARRAVVPQEPRNRPPATPTSPTPANGARPPAGVGSESTSSTADQHGQIRSLIGNAGMTMDELLNQLDITALSDLTAERAGKVIARLTRLGQTQAARAAQTAPDPNSPVADTPRLQAVR